MTSYNDGHRPEVHQPNPTEPETSSSRAARIRAFFESSSQPPHQLQPLPNIPLSLLINHLPSEGPDFPVPSNDPANQGLPASFLDTLDRVDKKSLKKDDMCPICTTPYLEDPFPLVVRLRCGHKFDLECVGIWFKEHSSCPMCRAAVEKRKPIVIPDDEEEYDDTFS